MGRSSLKMGRNHGEIACTKIFSFKSFRTSWQENCDAFEKPAYGRMVWVKEMFDATPKFGANLSNVQVLTFFENKRSLSRRTTIFEVIEKIFSQHSITQFQQFQINCFIQTFATCVGRMGQ